MKLTRQQLRKLIKEMYSPNFELMGIMSDIGSPMVKQLATYLIPYQGRVSFEIEDSSIGIDIKMFLDGAQIGYIGADFMADMCSNCYMVGMSSTAAGEERNDNNLYGFRLDLIKDDLFKIGSYGPILYELCLELISSKGMLITIPLFQLVLRLIPFSTLTISLLSLTSVIIYFNKFSSPSILMLPSFPFTKIKSINPAHLMAS